MGLDVVPFVWFSSVCVLRTLLTLVYSTRVPEIWHEVLLHQAPPDEAPRDVFERHALQHGPRRLLRAPRRGVLFPRLRGLRGLRGRVHPLFNIERGSAFLGFGSLP